MKLHGRRNPVAWVLPLLAGAALAATDVRPDLCDEWVRYFEARNAVANMMLAPPDALATASRTPGEQLMHPDGTTWMFCPVCDGKGAVISEPPDYGQWEGRMNRGKKERVRCPLCNGRKSWRAYFPPDELEATASLARQRFAAAHQSAGDVGVGNAFVPRTTHDAAERKLLKLAEKAYGKPCSRCDWTGVEECKACKGAGTVKCPNKECESGWIVTRTAVAGSHGRSHGASHGGRRHSSRRETVTVTQCQTCGAAARLICPECNGMRGAVCSKCRGSGLK